MLCEDQMFVQISLIAVDLDSFHAVWSIHKRAFHKGKWAFYRSFSKVPNKHAKKIFFFKKMACPVTCPSECFLLCCVIRGTVSTKSAKEMFCCSAEGRKEVIFIQYHTWSPVVVRWRSRVQIQVCSLAALLIFILLLDVIQTAVASIKGVSSLSRRHNNFVSVTLVDMFCGSRGICLLIAFWGYLYVSWESLIRQR